MFARQHGLALEVEIGELNWGMLYVAKKSTKSPPAPMETDDLNWIRKLDRVNAPKQARSEQRLKDIVRALDDLLDGRSFEEITIPQIAAQAGCVPASIYARFKDKTSILVALHESFRDQQIAQIDEGLRLERHENLSLEESVRTFVRNLVKHYARRKNLLRPTLLLNDREIYDRAAELTRHVSLRFAAIVRQKPGRADEDIDAKVDLGVRCVFGLLQQRLIFQHALTGRYSPTNDNDMVTELVLVFLSILSGRKK